MTTISHKSSTRRRPKYQLNFRWLAGTLLVVAIAAAILYFWHGFALRNSARSLLADATELSSEARTELAAAQDAKDSEKEKDANEKLSDAARMLWNYVQIRPDDPAGKVRLAEVYAEAPDGSANPRRAADLLRDAITVASPEKVGGLRVKLGERLIVGGKFQEAAVVASQCLKDPNFTVDPNAGQVADAWRLLAQGLIFQIGTETYTDDRLRALGLEPARQVGDVVAQAVAANPADAGLAVALAELYRSPERDRFWGESQTAELAENQLTPDARADQIVAELLQRNPESSPAYLASYQYKRRFGTERRDQALLQAADADLQRAYELDPSAPEVNLQMGDWHLRQANQITGGQDNPEATEARRSEFSAAQANFQTVVDASPQSQIGYLPLGTAQYSLGEITSAIATWNEGLKKEGPQSFELHRRLAATYIEQKDFDKAAAQLDTYRAYINRESRSARPGMARVLAEAYRTEGILRANLARAQGGFSAAIAQLLATIANTPERADKAQAYALLASIRRESGDVDRAADDVELASDLDPTNIEIARAAATILADKHPERAFAKFERLLALSDNPADYLNFAQLLQRSLLQGPAEFRNWGRFDQILAQAEKLAQTKPLEQPWRLDAVRVSGTLARSLGRPADSETASPVSEIPGLAALDAAANQNADACLQAIGVHLALGNQDRVTALLEEYKGLTAGTAEYYRLPAMVALRANDLATAEKTLNDGLAALKDWQQLRVLELEMVQLELREGELELALQRLDRVIQQHPDDTGLFWAALNLRIQSDQIPDDLTPWKSRLAELEEPNGPWTTYLEARAKLRAAEKAMTKLQRQNLFLEVESLQQRIERMRPTWETTFTLAGWLRDAQAQDNLADWTDPQRAQLLKQARAAFEQAVQLGERRPGVMYRLSSLIGDDDLRQSAQVLSLLNDQVVSAIPELAARKAELALRLNDLAEAERVAEAAVASRAGDVFSWLMLADVRLRQGRFNDANQAVKNAETLVEKLPENSAQLLLNLRSIFQFHVAAIAALRDPAAKLAQREQAKSVGDKILAQLDRQIAAKTLPPAAKDLEDASLTAMLKLPDAPLKFYELHQKAPADIESNEKIIAYFAANDAPEYNAVDIVIEALRRLVQADPQNNEYKVRLAAALSNRGTAQDWEESQALLTSTGNDASSSVIRRGRAALLFNRRNVPTDERIANLQAARDELNSLTAAPDATPSDHLLLAQLCDEWRRLLDIADAEQAERAETLRQDARTFYLKAATMPESGQLELFSAANFFISDKDFAQTERLINRWEQLQDFSVVPNAGPVALRVKLENARNAPDRAERITRLIDGFRKSAESTAILTPAAQANVYVRIASLYTLADQIDAALPWFRKAVELDETTAGNLISALGQQEQKAEAVELCRQIFESSKNVELIFALSNALVTGTKDVAAFDAAESLFQEALAAYPKDSRLPMAIGNCLASHPVKVDGAVEAYKKGLALDPKNVVLLNNLATVQADIPAERADGLKNIDQAIAIQGSHPALLNTKATVLMLSGQNEEALRIFQTIINTEADSRTWLNLAETYWNLFEKNGDATLESEARKAFQVAIDRGVESAVLTPYELTRLNNLREKIGRRP